MTNKELLDEIMGRLTDLQTIYEFNKMPCHKKESEFKLDLINQIKNYLASLYGRI